MNKIRNFFFPAMVLTLALSSCSSKLGTLPAGCFNVTPSPLEVQGGQVPVTIDGTFPEKFMNRKATVTVTPQLRFGTEKIDMGSQTFQGERVMGNNQRISYRTGGHYSMKASTTYYNDMQKSELWMTFDARIGKKRVDIPAVKVAKGILATAELYRQTMMNGGGCIAPDSFQRVKEQRQEANIKFLVNQATIRSSELKNQSVQDFVKMLRKINADRENLNIRDVEIQAYASPEGGFSVNDRLASDRQYAAEDYVRQQLKSTGLSTGIDARYTAQDWDGFQRLVQASNLQDKEIILRVLSMYDDPQVREEQIRNMGYAYQELATAILPELRRSRLIINYETIGRSDEQIRELYASNPLKLSPEEMLYLASIEDDVAKKEEIYKRATEYFDRDYRAFNNLAVLEFNKGNNEKAKEWLQKAFGVNSKAPESNVNLGLMALQQGNLFEAENYISKAGDAYGLEEALGNLNIAKGNFAQAEQYFNGSYTNSAALAQILNNNYAAAFATLKNVKNADALTDYLYAIVNARQNNAYAANSYLRSAIEKDPSLAVYADKDMEFDSIRK